MSTREGRSGRPVVTSREEIEQVAFELFERLGYEETSMARIADELGVGRRTVFRYFASKHDIPWAAFDRELTRLEQLLAAQPAELSLLDAAMNAVTVHNNVSEPGLADHRVRMRLIMQEPSLQSHSAMKYVQWRGAIERFVAAREGCRPDDPLPRLVAFTTNAIGISAYTEWLRDPSRPIVESFDRARTLLRDQFA